MLRPPFAAAFFFVLAILLRAPLLSAEAQTSSSTARPLHSRIDELIEGAAVGPLAPICSDADFVRRIYLAPPGIIPAADEARDFLADQTADKRERLIDKLLASPAFVRHMTTTLDVLLMERKPD